MANVSFNEDWQRELNKFFQGAPPRLPEAALQQIAQHLNLMPVPVFRNTYGDPDILEGFLSRLLVCLKPEDANAPTVLLDVYTAAFTAIATGSRARTNNSQSARGDARNAMRRVIRSKLKETPDPLGEQPVDKEKAADLMDAIQDGFQDFTAEEIMHDILAAWKNQYEAYKCKMAGKNTRQQEYKQRKQASKENTNPASTTKDGRDLAGKQTDQNSIRTSNEATHVLKVPGIVSNKWNVFALRKLEPYNSAADHAEYLRNGIVSPPSKKSKSNKQSDFVSCLLVGCLGGAGELQMLAGGTVERQQLGAALDEGKCPNAELVPIDLTHYDKKLFDTMTAEESNGDIRWFVDVPYKQGLIELTHTPKQLLAAINSAEDDMVTVTVHWPVAGLMMHGIDGSSSLDKVLKELKKLVV